MADKTSKRTIGLVFAMVRGSRETLTGQTIATTTSHSYGEEVELTVQEEARLDALGALKPKDGGEASAPAGGLADHPSTDAAAALSVDEDGVTLPKTVATGVVSGDHRPASFSDPAAPAYTPHGQGIDSVKDWLEGKQNVDGKAPTIDQIVEAVGDDAGTARMVLQAEDQVNDGDSRSGLVKALSPVAGRA